MKTKNKTTKPYSTLNRLLAAAALAIGAINAQGASLTWSDTADYNAGWTAWTTWTLGWNDNTTAYVNGSDVVFNGGGGSNAAVWETQHYNVGTMSFSGKDYFVGTTPGTGHTASLTLTNGNIDVDSGITATFVNNAGSGQFALHGSAGITKSGGGTLVLSAPSDITGTVTVSAGKLQIGNGSMDGSITTTSGIANSAAVEFKVIGSQSYTAGIGGTGSLTKSGAGILELAGTNTYSGTTYISGGTLSASVYAGAARHYDASTLGLADGADITTWTDLSGNGANATVPGGNDNPTYIANAGTGTGLGAVSFLGNAGANDSQALTFSRDTNVRSVFSIFKGSSFLLTDTQGEYDLHRASNTNPADPLITNYGQVNYLGTVYVNGTAVNPLADAMPTGSNNGYNLVEIITNGNPMQLDGFNKDRIYHSGDQSHAETILFDTVVSESQRLQIEAYLNKKWFGTGSGIGNLMSTTSDIVLSSGGTLDLSGQNYQTLKSLSSTDNSGTQVAIGAVALTVGDAASTTFDGVISGSGGSLIKAGAGTLTLSGANNYTGGTTVNGGTLVLSGAANASNSDITMANSANLTFAASNARSFTKAITGTAGDVTFNVAGNTSATGGGDGTNFAFQNTGAFTGNVVINSGLVAPSGDAAFGNTANVIKLNAASGQSAGLVATGSITLPSTRSIELTTAGGNGIFRAYTGNNFEIAGAISGAGNLVKTDGGTLTLTGTNTYTGATNVSAGKLVINGNNSAAIGALTVSNADTRLTGGGSIGGDTTINAGAIHSAGNSVGKQTFHDGVSTDLTYAQGSIFEWELGTTLKDSNTPGADRGTDWDAVNVSGNLATTGSGAIFRVVLDGTTTFGDGFWTQNRQWLDIFKTADAGTLVNFQSVFTSFQHYNYSGVNGSLADLGDVSSYGSFTINGTSLTWTAVPEPTSALAGLLLTAGLLRRRRAHPGGGKLSGLWH